MSSLFCLILFKNFLFLQNFRYFLKKCIKFHPFFLAYKKNFLSLQVLRGVYSCKLCKEHLTNEVIYIT